MHFHAIPPLNVTKSPLLRRFPGKVLHASPHLLSYLPPRAVGCDLPPAGGGQVGGGPAGGGAWGRTLSTCSPLQPPPAGGRQGVRLHCRGPQRGRFFLRNRLTKSPPDCRRRGR